jgi:hypothetical protein
MGCKGAIDLIGDDLSIWLFNGKQSAWDGLFHDWQPSLSGACQGSLTREFNAEAAGRLENKPNKPNIAGGLS